MENSAEDTLAILEQAAGHRFKDRRLLVEAMTHRSFLNEVAGRGPDNERLEFFGDSILSFCVSQQLLLMFPESSEGVLTRARATLVNERSLALRAGELRLGDHLRLGRGEARSGGRTKPSILADAYEALLAAIYLDGGLEPVQRLVKGQFEPLLPTVMMDLPGRDAKTNLQEKSQSLYGVTPRYRVKDVAGPDHQRHFTVIVAIGEEDVAEGAGHSKKEAEQQAARRAMERLLGAGDAEAGR